MQGRQIWIRFATWILLALEFALAADLVRTAVAPTWDDIAKLAVIATIRTMRCDVEHFSPGEMEAARDWLMWPEGAVD